MSVTKKSVKKFYLKKISQIKNLKQKDTATD